MVQTCRQYLAFDIETAKQTPGDFSQWRLHRPLGITCAATCTQDGELRRWHSVDADGKPMPRMTQADASRLVLYLCGAIAQGYTILTWNGAGFDFDVLAEESGALADCCRAAHDHVDMMFHIVCKFGHGIKLAKAAEALGLPGKYDGMSGADAPRLWAQGEYETVLCYVEQDVRLALLIATECEKVNQIAWISRKGTLKFGCLGGGWLSVREALTLPLPDTTGLEKPIVREEFLAWTRIDQVQARLDR